MGAAIFLLGSLTHGYLLTELWRRSLSSLLFRTRVSSAEIISSLLLQNVLLALKVKIKKLNSKNRVNSTKLGIFLTESAKINYAKYYFSDKSAKISSREIKFFRVIRENREIRKK